MAPNGTIYVSRRDQGDVLMLKDADGDGKADGEFVPSPCCAAAGNAVAKAARAAAVETVIFIELLQKV